MVDFETEVYNKSGENITGVKVIIQGENAEVLDTIQVHNKTEFDALVTELNEKLDVIDETYIQAESSALSGLSIEEILENNNSNVNINATTLNGQQSGSFSPYNHSHSKSSITDLYDYQLQCDAKEITLGTAVNIAVQVNNQSGQGVANAPVRITVNNTGVITGNTNNAGKFTTTYTPQTIGLYCFAIQDQMDLVNVKNEMGSSEVITGKCTVYYEPTLKLCQVIINGSFSISANGNLGTNVLSNFKPKATMPFAVFTTGLNISISETTGNIYYVNNSGSNGSKTVVASAMYFYK